MNTRLSFRPGGFGNARVIRRGCALIALCLFAAPFVLLASPDVIGPGPSGDSTAVPSDSPSALKPGGLGAVLRLEGMITDVTVESLRRRIEQAKALGVSVIVLDLDTPGGLVTSSIAIADLMRELVDIKTVAWVNPNAHSGGTIVAVSCDEIVMARSSRMGNSQVILGGPQGASGVPEDLQAKAYTPVLADFRQSASLRGYSQVLSEAFVLPEREVWWIEHKETGERRFVFREDKERLVGPSTDAVPGRKEKSTTGDVKDAAQSVVKAATEGATLEGEGKLEGEPSAIGAGRDAREWRLVEKYHDVILDREVDAIQPVDREDQLLEMSASEGFAYGFSKAVVSSESDLMARYGLASITRMEPNWSEALAYWLTSMYVRGFLLVVIFLSAYVEFHTPGVGLAGLVALVALIVFVGAPYLTGLANIWEILLIAVGVVLMLVELFVLPGFGVAGISGIVCILLGLLATFMPDEPGRDFPLFVPGLPGTLKFLRDGVMVLCSSIVASAIGMVMLSRILPRTVFFRRLVPANPTPSEVMVDDPYRGAARIGDGGVTEGPLRPAGKARFGFVLVDVVTQGEFVDSGAAVEVIERRGNHVVVRSIRS